MDNQKTQSPISSFLNNFMFGYIPAKYFLIMLVVVIVGLVFKITAPGFLGGFTLCSILGLLLVTIGDNTPIVNTYLGGGGIIAIFGAAIIAYLNILPESTATMLTAFVKDMDYIGWVVAGLICGSILTMDRKLLIKAGIRYFLPIVAGIICAFTLTGLIGKFSGFGWRQAILFIALPIMGGGTSAGAVPTSQTYGMLMTQSSEYYLSLLMPAVVIGNALAVIFAGILNGVGKKRPSTTGNGILMRGFTVEERSFDKAPISIVALGRGFIITGLFFTLGKLCAMLMPQLHYYAWTIILCAICKITDIVPDDLQSDLNQWYKFMVKVGAGPAVYFAIGFVYTNLDVVIASMSVSYLLMTLSTIIGAVLGSWFVGKALGFFPVESAITAGLCMANMGGSGDIATLGAANRMELMPFSQISSRIGGALIIVIASILPRLIGAGL
ncbi:MAG: 2-hydroxycarboxylate transporter family protein [Oscillospiraceae bacterium]